ncbi:MAG: TonB-dependent receptor, partial [Polaromonas sp.]|nr:TonB-dependent receptor [Gemmatimonadaceae bacterium]
MGNGVALLIPDDTLALHATGEHKIAGSWFAFGEFTFARERSESKDTELSLPNVTVGADNPFNPFGEAVKVTALLGPVNGLHGFERHTRFTRAVAGLRGSVAGDWETEVTLSSIRDDGGSRNFNIQSDAAARAAALISSSPATALNPFTTGHAASENVLRGIWSDDVSKNHGRKDELSALVRGSVVQLPAGSVEAVLGAESARDRYDVSIPEEDEEIHDGRRNSAVFGELRAPFIKMGTPGNTWSLATLTLAARRDRYSDFGSAGTYQSGLEIRPTRAILIRASSATSFKPPTLLETNVSESTASAEDYGLVDPARGDEAITSATVVRDSNKALDPERGRASSFGIVWEPEGNLGTRLGATYWRVRVNDLISLVDPQTVLNYERLFPGLVTRGPSTGGQPGPVTNVEYTDANFGSVQVAGTDMEAAYAWRGFLGRWTASAGATHTGEYGVVLAPGATKEDRLGRRFTDFWAPRW